MAIAVDPNQKLPFVLKRDRELPKEQQTTFYSRVISIRRMQDLSKQLSKRGKQAEMAFALDDLVDLLDEFLAGWENFHLPDGAIAEFKLASSPNGVRRISEESWKYIDSLDFLRDLFEGCVEANHLGEVTVKN